MISERRALALAALSIIMAVGWVLVGVSAGDTVGDLRFLNGGGVRGEGPINEHYRAVTYDGSGKAEKGHDPLSKRIFRRNKTSGPIPPIWFIAGFIGAGTAGIFLIAALVSKMIDRVAKLRNGPPLSLPKPRHQAQHRVCEPRHLP